MSEQPSVAVTGTGVATGTPDQCQLQISLVCRADDAGDALTTCAELAAAAAAAAAATAAIAAIDIERRDVQTVGLSVHDLHDQSTHRVTGKIGTYQLDITVRPVERAGSDLAMLGGSAADALQVRGIRLSMQDPEPLRSEARRLAVEDAKRKAEELSHAAGIRLGPILAMQEGSAQARPVLRAMAMSASSTPSVPIEAGEVSAVSSITITYSIGP